MFSPFPLQYLFTQCYIDNCADSLTFLKSTVLMKDWKASLIDFSSHYSPLMPRIKGSHGLS